MPATLNIQRVIAAQAQRFLQRHFKHRRHFIDAGMIMKVRRDNPNHRRDLETGNAVDRGQYANDLDGFWRNGDLLMRYPQRGGNQRGIGAVYRAARKGDLTGMFTHMRRSLGEQQARLFAPHHRDQHRPLTLIQRFTVHCGSQKLKALPKIIQRQVLFFHPSGLQLLKDTVNFIKSFLIFRIDLAVGHNAAPCGTVQIPVAGG